MKQYIINWVMLLALLVCTVGALASPNLNLSLQGDETIKAELEQWLLSIPQDEYNLENIVP